MRVEHGADQIGQVLWVAHRHVGCGQGPQRVEHGTKSARRHVAYLVDASQDVFDRVVHFLAGPGNQVTVPSPVVVGQAAGRAGGR